MKPQVGWFFEKKKDNRLARFTKNKDKILN